MSANGILLLYHHPLAPSASTIMEHVDAFGRYSRFKVWSINTELGFPEGLKTLSFQGILLHYSLFGPRYEMSEMFLDYLERSRGSYKIAFFQDEHRFCQKRFAFLNHFKIDCVFTLVEPSYYRETYQKYTKVPKLVYTIPGYVSDTLIEMARYKTIAEELRTIDIGYRGRKLETYMGKGSQEKHGIAVEFSKRAGHLDLRLDIEAEERKRIYGEGWYDFVAQCRAVLGVEAGVSVFDVEDIVYRQYLQLSTSNPKMRFEEVSKQLLDEWEDRIPYRTISPRHFEAVALRVCQILFEGAYSGILQPMLHYLPLKKDFSNFDEVIRMVRDRSLRSEITEKAYGDLIVSGRFSYGKFIQEIFDKTLLESGLRPEVSSGEAERVTHLLTKDTNKRRVYAGLRSLLYCSFPGRRAIISRIRPLFAACRKGKDRSPWHVPIR
ncbi:MAG: hypothetical protein A2157_05410 [Deltaproteobacteria bacterium RBG_16_47_11]|nr:MAG: hypothetical protein A2157_05410 [Deltaproteobacteria bacterium RBG_16_47_11]